jgi:hypothetical protein
MALASGAPPVLAETKPPAVMILSRPLLSTTRSFSILKVYVWIHVEMLTH